MVFPARNEQLQVAAFILVDRTYPTEITRRGPRPAIGIDKRPHRKAILIPKIGNLRGPVLVRLILPRDGRVIGTARERKKRVEQLILGMCKKGHVSLSELKGGSRRGTIPRVRAEIANSLVDQYGLPLAEVARQVGVSTSAISKAMRRDEK